MSGKSDQRDLLVETECGTVQGVVAHGMGFAGRHGCQTASKFLTPDWSAPLDPDRIRRQF